MTKSVKKVRAGKKSWKKNKKLIAWVKALQMAKKELKIPKKSMAFPKKGTKLYKVTRKHYRALLSKKKTKFGKRRKLPPALKLWIASLAQARKELKIEGFKLPKKGTKYYKRAKAIYKAKKGVKKVKAKMGKGKNTFQLSKILSF